MKKRVIDIIVSMLLLAMAGCNDKTGIPDLTETYSYKDTKPFGTYAAKKIVEAGYGAENIKITRRAFSKTYAESSDTNSLYFCISRNMYVTDDDAQAMLDYVYIGNTLFISAANFDTLLLARLLCEEVKADAVMEMMQVDYMPAPVSLAAEIDPSKSNYSYYYKPFANYFSSIKANYSYVVGYNSSKRPNAFILFWGKGRMILHCDPRAFSNYFLLKNNDKYLQKLLEISGGQGTVYWDDYYRNQNVRRQGNRSFSTFSELMKHPPLALAFWILLGLLALYVLFNSKRRQRIIPVIKPNENSTIAFTETIARLYLQHHDNKNIADKMITYFNEFIRKNYFLNVNATNSDFIAALSRKSGVSFEQTTALFNAIGEANEQASLDDQQLLTLNEHIQQFYKNRN